MVVEKVLQKFSTEYHKGVAIQVVKKILGDGQPKVIARWAMQGRRYEIKGDTKNEVVAVAKERINRSIG